ncbi:uncharacterized protein KD926_008684 [Aspergillus affinis]|uniref:uncharacterized protein n=1 Tax=Aspergillus affinis TaxID=1070780 RepID=UPI0022FE8B8B|nr:uncharacterized protein KD926_008684 [Aspergillus affinis]KAI9039993.1 hypothetical protein KD926_008684 [Aspergillus affinis]
MPSLASAFFHCCLAMSFLVAYSTAHDIGNDVESQNRAGAEGPSDDGVGVTSTGMIILCTIVGVVVVIGISSAALFFIAKRRQWAMRETLRRSARHVVDAVKTPLTPKFSRSQLRLPPSQSSLNPILKRTATNERIKNNTEDNDLEKNAVVTEIEASAGGKPRTWGSMFAFGRNRAAATADEGEESSGHHKAADDVAGGIPDDLSTVSIMEDPEAQIASQIPSDALSEHDIRSDSNIDEEDELLLVQMANTNTPTSPNLDAVTYRPTDTNWESRPKAASPLLVERPQSSGVDVSAFSFARPLRQGKQFSIQSSARRVSKDSRTHSSGPPVNGNGNETRQPIGVEGGHEWKGRSRQRVPQASDLQHGVSQQSVIEPPEEQLRNVQVPLDDDESRSVTHGVDTRQTPSARAQSAGRNRSRSLATSQITEIEDREQGRGSKRSRSVVAVDYDEPAMEDDSSAQHPPASLINEGRMAKRRRSNGKKVSLKDNALKGHSQLSEEHLFQLLINKVKMREEGDIAASKVKEQMQIHVMELTEENKCLREDLGACQTHLQRREADLKSHMLRMETWKTKLTNFRGFLNEFGADYKVLRGEAIQLKVSRTHLDKEKKEIEASLVGAKEHISQVSNLLDERRSRLSETVHTTELLKQSLTDTEVRVKLFQDQLTHERKRSSALESYIRQQTSVQSKKLGLVVSNQVAIMTTLVSKFQIIGSQLESIKFPIFGNALDECLVSLKQLNESHSAGIIDVRRVEEVIKEFTVRIDAVGINIASELHGGSEANNNLAVQLKEQLRYLADSMNTGSSILQKLSENEKCCGVLQKSLGVIIPTIDNLNSSMKIMDGKGHDITRQIEHLGKSISEIKIPDKVELVPVEPCMHAKEKIELELQVQKLVAELKIAGEALKDKECHNEETNNALLEATSKIQETEARVKQLKTQIIKLEDNVKTTEVNVREELNRASIVARDEHRKRFEQQLHGVLREKTEIEKEINKLQEQLVNSHQEIAEKENLFQQKQAEIEIALSDKEGKIQTLESLHAENTAKLAEKEEEIRKLHEVEVANGEQLESLQQELIREKEKLASSDAELFTARNDSQVKLAEKEEEIRRLHEIEVANGEQVGILQQELNREKEKLVISDAELYTLTNESQKATLELEAKLESLRTEILRKDEYCKSLASELSAANSAKKRLESGKSKAKSEIHALLWRVQGAESRMKNVKEALDQMRSTSSQESISNAWSRLEDLLQLGTLKKSTDCQPMDSGSQVKPTSDAPVGTPLAQVSQGDCQTPGQGALQTTEFIYRTESIQRRLFPSSNEEGLAVGSSQPALSRNIGIPGSQSSAGIIPFSNFRQEISPTPCSGSAESFVDFAIMSGMMPTESKTLAAPETADKAGETRVIASQVVDSQLVEQTTETPPQTSRDAPSVVQTEPIGEEIPIENLPAKQKTVKFQSQDSGADEEKRQHPAFDENWVLERTKPREKKMIRTNQRTYSRTRQLSYTSKEEKTVRQQSSRIEETSDLDGPGPSRSNIRKTTASAASSATRTQRKGSSEYPERKASPASLASGSSKYPSAQGTHPNNGRWTRGSRGRKARGERYNARFNKET